MVRSQLVSAHIVTKPSTFVFEIRQMTISEEAVISDEARQKAD